MLTVTIRAIRKLKEVLRDHSTDRRQGIRLVLTPTGVAPFDFILDEEWEGDQVVRGEDGSMVLLVGPHLAAALSRMEIDYRITPIGSTFALLPSTPVN